ncbi:MAG: hypothetical protein A2V70_19665, partial [Planctomycetes bacterium RBG_13_63_9]
MIYVGMDDTDTLDAPGTNKVARSLVRELASDYPCVMVVRHQLLFDPRVPYTRKNSSASILFRPCRSGSTEDLCGRLRRAMLDRFVEGSDPGLCVAEDVPEEVIKFGRRCQRDVVGQREARQLAAARNIRLEGLGGTEDGVVGALAAVGLVAGGNDGRVVGIAQWGDELAGPQDVSLLVERGVAEVRCVETGELIDHGTVDVGKRLRPNYRGGKIVLFVSRSPECWRA